MHFGDFKRMGDPPDQAAAARDRRDTHVLGSADRYRQCPIEPQDPAGVPRQSAPGRRDEALPARGLPSRARIGQSSSVPLGAGRCMGATDMNRLAPALTQRDSCASAPARSAHRAERLCRSTARNPRRLAGMFTLFLLVSAAVHARPYNRRYPPPPARDDVTISNGGLSVTFNTAWGAAVVAIRNRRIAKGLNLVDTHDVGRELQVDQFLSWRIHGQRSLLSNPTQAGAQGHQRFYQHPHGVLHPQVGSPVVHWRASRNHFHALIHPLDYDTGKPASWVYVENVAISPTGVAHFQFEFHNHEPRAYLLQSEVPTLYSDRTDEFMFPLVSPFGHAGAILRGREVAKWPVATALAHHWPGGHLISKGWIANIDARDDIGIFYTTPVGLPETYGVFPKAAVRGRDPLGKSNVTMGRGRISYPGEVYCIEFSVLVSTPRNGPALISRQPPAVLRIVRNRPPALSSSVRTRTGILRVQGGQPAGADYCPAPF